MAYQFIRLETYSRKKDSGGRNTAFIFDEVSRVPEASTHVAAPLPPVLVFGQDVASLRHDHDVACAAAKETNKTGVTRGIRQDQKTLVTIVTSHPAFSDEVASDPTLARDVDKWQELSIGYLREKYGDALKTVVRHDDEAHPHLHAYILPDNLRAAKLHPGVAAKAAEKERLKNEGHTAKALNKLGDSAYKAAMRDFQDSYFQAVGVPCGLSRLGPKKRRLTRAQWQAEKSQAAALKIATEKAEKLHEKSMAYMDDVRSQAADVVADVKAARRAERDAAARVVADAAAVQVAAEAARVEAEHLREAALAQVDEAKRIHDRAVAKEKSVKVLINKAKSEAARIVDAAHREAEKLVAAGSKIRKFFDGFRKTELHSEIRGQVEKEFEMLFNTLKSQENSARTGEREYKEKLKIAEKNMIEMRGENRLLLDEISRARDKIAAPEKGKNHVFSKSY